MAVITDPGTHDPLSALSWVQEELRRSLETANKALRRYLKEQEQRGDLDTIDPAVLRQARSQLHQSVGVLELVGLGPAAELLRAAEAALLRLSGRPKMITTAAVDTIERGTFALLEFIDRRLAGKTVSTLALFPQYRALQELAGATRVHPADLWGHDWSWRELALDPAVAPRHPDEPTLNRIEADLLVMMRGAPPSVAARMSELFAGLAAGAQSSALARQILAVEGDADADADGDGLPALAIAPRLHSRLATLWQLAAGFFEAQADGLLQPDAYSKRVGSKLLAQLRSGEAAAPSERLAQDLLFFCAQATPRNNRPVGPRLATVRQGYKLAEAPATDYESARLGRFDPAWIAQARKRVTSAKEVWSAVAGGDSARLGGLSEQFALVADSLARLYPDGGLLGRALQVAVAHTTALNTEPPADLAMEVATALLYLEASLDDGDFDNPDGAQRIHRLAQRIDAVRQARDPGTLEIWMEELYRRVSDRQTMGSVVQELRSSLSEVEKNIDQYFRNPTQREVLIPVPGQLSAMRGVLSVLGLDQASQAVLRMRDDVDALASTEVNPQRAIETGTFDRLADNLGALSFLIDMVSVQPQMAKSLFRFDAETGALSAVMARQDRPTGFDEFDTAVAAETGAQPQTDALAVTLEFDRIVKQARIAQRGAPAAAAGPGLTPPPRLGSHGLPMISLDDAAAPRLPPDTRPPTAADTAPAALSGHRGLPAFGADIRKTGLPPGTGPDTQPAGLEDDPEMREVFLEEALDVLTGARSALQTLQARHDDPVALTTLRRAFHTLKGSARMVGLGEFGEAAWACEQLFNARLAAPGSSADHDLRDFSRHACAYFAQWVEAFTEGDASGFNAEHLAQPASALRRRAAASVAEMAADDAVDVAADDAAGVAADLVDDMAADAAAGFAAGRAARAIAPIDAAALALPLSQRVPDLPSAADLDLLPLDALLADLPPLPALETLPATLLPQTLDDADAVGGGSVTRRPGSDPADGPVTDLVLDFGTDADGPASVDFVLDELAPAGAVQRPQPAEYPPMLAGPLSGPAERANLPPEPAELADSPPSTSPSVHALTLQPQPVLPSEPDAEAYRQIGPLRIGIPLFNIYLNEADELSRRLGVELAEWALEQHRPVGETAVALAHSLAGNSGAVGYADLLGLARELEHALGRSQARGHSQPGESLLFTRAADEIRRLLHLFAAGFLNSPDAELLQALRELSHAAPGAAPADPLAGGAPAPSPTPPATRPVGEAAPGLAPAAPLAQGLQGVPGVPVHGGGADAAGAVLGRSTLLPFSPLAPFAALSQPETAAPRAGGDGGAGFDEDIDQVDMVDAELFPYFVEEAQELLPQLQACLREWAQRPGEREAASACMRSLHTFKGSARLAGAMRLGELAHRLETEVERLAAAGTAASAASVEALVVHADLLEAGFDALRTVPAAAAVPALPTVSARPAAAPVKPDAPAKPDASAKPGTTAKAATTSTPAGAGAAPAALPGTTRRADLPAESAAARLAARPAGPPRSAADPAAAVPIDWRRFATSTVPADGLPSRAGAGVAAGSVRVRAPLLDRLVNHAGEVSITRARIESDVGQLKGGLGDLNDNLERLRTQLRDIELQAETQIGTRMEAARAAAQQFDPLEMDRFTRFQELTRMMAESVADVATVQRSLQRTLQSTEDALAHQARMTRDMQDDLLRTRMIEFEGLSERLYRVVRQAAKETGKAVRLDIVGGSIEIDRGVLDRMLPAFEHLLRNSVVHGVESAAQRSAAGKAPVGTITLAISHVGNEVGVEVRDDGAGLDLPRIRERALAMGLISADAQPDDAELANLIFQSGFSTAATITDLAGRGVGMDVVRTDVNAMGGRIETASAPGLGTSIRLVLPLTTAVTQVVMLRCGQRSVAVPSTLVEVVRRVPLAELARAYATGQFGDGAQALPFFWLDALLMGTASGQATGRTAPVVVIRSAAQRVMLHVDEVVGNQEVVVKNLGPQLSRVPGLVGMTLLPSGLPALIYNPVALATLYGDAARSATLAAVQVGGRAAGAVADAAPLAPLVLVVDDSLTVRRITRRLLEREGYRVTVAKDGLDGLDKLGAELPAVLLTDIEMPRMDGFDLVRNMRVDARLAGLPVIMITSRIAQKHRDYAAELGVDHYLGKPYVEDELLSLVARYARHKHPA